MLRRVDSDLALENVFYWATHAPDRVYLTQPMDDGTVKEWTWANAVGEARRMAAHLQSLGLPEKSHIAILSKNCAYWILADLAIWMAGHVSVPLYPTLTADSLRTILEHSDSVFVFVGKIDDWDTMKPGVPSHLGKIALPLSPPNDYDSWTDIVARTEPLSGEIVRHPDDLATIVYTSGSTGAPKGVMHTFRAMGEPAVAIGHHLRASPEDRLLSYLPLSHVFERFIVEMTSFIWGFHIFFAETLDTFVQDLQRARPTLFISVPRLWLKFQQGVTRKLPQGRLDLLLKLPIMSGLIKTKVLKTLGLDQVRFAGSGSAPIPPELIAWYRRLGLELLEGYGMTENFCYSHISVPGRARVGYVGEPYAGVECRISPEGEVQVKTPGNMLGYYKAPDLTVAMFTADGFLKTGDRGEIDELGRLKITGRVKELFKTSKGKYVAPAPIENAILTNSIIEQACVTGSGHPQPHALIVLAEDVRARLAAGAKAKEDITSELQAILTAINATLDHHEQLQFFTVVAEPWQIENGFLTPTMKIKRATIEAAYAPRAPGWYANRQAVIWE